LQKSTDAYNFTPRGLIKAMETGRKEDFRRLTGSMDLRETPVLLRELSDVIMRAYRDLKASENSTGRKRG